MVILIKRSQVLEEICLDGKLSTKVEKTTTYSKVNELRVAIDELLSIRQLQGDQDRRNGWCLDPIGFKKVKHFYPTQSMESFAGFWSFSYHYRTDTSTTETNNPNNIFMILHKIQTLFLSGVTATFMTIVRCNPIVVIGPLDILKIERVTYPQSSLRPVILGLRDQLMMYS